MGESKVVTGIIVVLLLALIFWDKIFGNSMLGNNPQVNVDSRETVTSTVAGMPVDSSGNTAMAAATSGIYPSNAPEIKAYTPGPVPLFSDSHVFGPVDMNNIHVSAFHHSVSM